MIIGVHGLTDEKLRLQEYSPVFDAERFAAHEKFFVEDVLGGYSRGLASSWPLNALRCTVPRPVESWPWPWGFSTPTSYGVICCASPGAGYKPTEVMPSQVPRTYLVAGTQEPFFLENATRWADALRDAGADVVMKERAGSHGGAFLAKRVPADDGVDVLARAWRLPPATEGSLANVCLKHP
jgi:hypothetical protein